MGIFDEVGGANETAKSGYFYPGIYLVELARVKHNPNGFNGESVVIEGKVLAVRSSDDQAPEPGEHRAHVISGFDKNNRKEMALGDLKAFTRAAYNNHPSIEGWTPQQWNEAASKIVGETLAGKVMKLECFMNAAGTFTIHRWLGHASAADYAEFGLVAPVPAA